MEKPNTTRQLKKFVNMANELLQEGKITIISKAENGGTVFHNNPGAVSIIIKYKGG